MVKALTSQPGLKVLPMPVASVSPETLQRHESALKTLRYVKDDEAIYSVSRGGLNIELMKLADGFENVTFHFN